MDAREQFKFEFMARCIDIGLTTPEEMLGAAKVAHDHLEKQGNPVSAVWDAVRGTVGSAAPLAATALVAGPAALSYAAGNMIGTGIDYDDIDAKDVKKQELVEEYRRQAAIVRRRQLLRTHSRDQLGDNKVLL